MIVKNIYNKKIINYIDLTVRLLIKNNINYVLINNGDYTEIHFNNYIYNIYSNKKLYIDKKITDINEDVLFLNNNEIIGCIYSENINEKTGFKKYTKSKIKKDNQNNRLYNRYLGAKSPRR